MLWAFNINFFIIKIYIPKQKNNLHFYGSL